MEGKNSGQCRGHQILVRKGRGRLEREWGEYIQKESSLSDCSGTQDYHAA
jgi:hypothetical protein